MVARSVSPNGNAQGRMWPIYVARGTTLFGWIHACVQKEITPDELNRRLVAWETSFIDGNGNADLSAIVGMHEVKPLEEFIISGTKGRRIARAVEIGVYHFDTDTKFPALGEGT